MSETKKIRDTIHEAEAILSGEAPSPEEKIDARWQAVIALGKFIETNPYEVWQFIRKWGAHKDDDIRSDIATCLLEHLLEFDFETYFPKVEIEVKESLLFEDMFCGCSKFGQAEEPVNAKRFDYLQDKCRRIR